MFSSILNRKSLILAFALFSSLFAVHNSEAQPNIITCDSYNQTTGKVTLQTQRGEASGKVCLDDGDSLSIGPTWMRLSGIDAPALGRNCKKNMDELRCKIGAEAANALADLLMDGASCKATERDGFNRWSATCTLPSGGDLGAKLVEQGFACAATKYGDQYEGLEKAARAAGKGLWAKGSGIDFSKACKKMGKHKKAAKSWWQQYVSR